MVVDIFGSTIDVRRCAQQSVLSSEAGIGACTDVTLRTSGAASGSDGSSPRATTTSGGEPIEGVCVVERCRNAIFGALLRLFGGGACWKGQGGRDEGVQHGSARSCVMNGHSGPTKAVTMAFVRHLPSPSCYQRCNTPKTPT